MYIIYMQNIYTKDYFRLLVYIHCENDQNLFTDLGNL